MKHSNNPLRRTLLGAIAGAALLATTPAALAQAYPSKPIRLVVVAPAGGSSDIVARTLADGLTPLLGQTVIVDNKPGGLGAIGAQDLLSSPHDGYTFLIAPNGLVSEIPHIVKPRFDPVKDIKPLAELSRSGLVMVGNAALPASNLKEVVAYVKANPGKLSYASYSTGTVSHNLVVSGINLLALKNARLQVGGALLEIVGPCQPCSRMEETIARGGYAAMRGHGGMTARVITTGLISVGSVVRAEQ